MFQVNIWIINVNHSNPDQSIPKNSPIGQYMRQQHIHVRMNRFGIEVISKKKIQVYSMRENYGEEVLNLVK